MKHTAFLEVRSYELDSYGHVNNANYLNYLEYGRMEFLRAIDFDYEGLVHEGYCLYITQIDIKYKHSARLFDALAIEVEPIKVGKLSGTFYQTIYNQNHEVCATATVSWGCVTKEGRPAKLPEKFLVPEFFPEKKP